MDASALIVARRAARPRFLAALLDAFYLRRSGACNQVLPLETRCAFPAATTSGRRGVLRKFTLLWVPVSRFSRICYLASKYTGLVRVSVRFPSHQTAVYRLCRRSTPRALMALGVSARELTELMGKR